MTEPQGLYMCDDDDDPCSSMSLRDMTKFERIYVCAIFAFFIAAIWVLTAGFSSYRWLRESVAAVPKRLFPGRYRDVR